MSKGLDEINRLWESLAKGYLLACEVREMSNSFEDTAMIDYYYDAMTNCGKRILDREDVK